MKYVTILYRNGDKEDFNANSAFVSRDSPFLIITHPDTGKVWRSVHTDCIREFTSMDMK